MPHVLAEVVKNIKSVVGNSLPNAIILSHWDVDHILAVGYLDSSIIFNRKFIWLAPDLSLVPLAEISHSAYRLCLYLAIKAKLCLIQQAGAMVCNSGDGNFELWQGKGKRGHSTTSNNIGLIIKLKGLSHQNIHSISRPLYRKYRDCKILLSGDCEYEQMPSGIVNEQYSLLVAPHHGSNLIMPNFKAELDEGQCIISVGKNTFGHPGGKHIIELSKKEFKEFLPTNGRKSINFHIFNLG